VYSSKEAGSSLVCFKAVIKFEDMTLSDLVAFLCDLSNRLTWDTSCACLSSHSLHEWAADNTDKTSHVLPQDKLHIRSSLEISWV